MVETAYLYHIQIVFIITAMMGGVMHYLKKFLKGETTVKLYEWYGKANLPATIYTIVVFFFAIVGALAADVITSQTGFWAAMYSGFVTGFAIDSGFNSDADPSASLAHTKANLVELLGEQKQPEDETTPEKKTVTTEVDGKKVTYKPKA